MQHRVYQHSNTPGAQAARARARHADSQDHRIGLMHRLRALAVARDDARDQPAGARLHVHRQLPAQHAAAGAADARDQLPPGSAAAVNASMPKKHSMRS